MGSEIKHDFRVIRTNGMQAELLLEYNSEEPIGVEWIDIHGAFAGEVKQGDRIEVTLRKKEASQ